MANQYIFIPWLRRGLAGRIDDADPLSGGNPGDTHAGIQLGIKILADDAEQKVVTKEIQLTGPGDIVGFNRSAVVKTEPAAGIRNFEPNFLPYVEFYEEDFPWRYTPAKAASDRRLRPWIILVVLEETEFDFLTVRSGSNNRVIRILKETMEQIFPPSEQTWAWAHAQLNDGALSGNELADPGMRNRKLADSLLVNPNLGVSRLLCPRKLKPDTAYNAFIIPAFERGRIAGLGGTKADIDGAGKFQSSWRNEQIFKPEQYPVYYEWNFQTGADEFEDLARRIAPRDLTGSDVGRLWMDASSINYGNKFDYHGNLEPDNPSRKGFLPFEGALRLPVPPAPNLIKRTGAEEKKFTANFSTLINLGVQYRQKKKSELGWSIAELGNDADDPLLVPPIYGRWYANPNGSMLTDPDQTGHWFEQLNLDPALRVAAGLGAEVVKENQEEFLSRAWEQLDENRKVLNTKLNKLRFAQEVTKAAFKKHFLQNGTATDGGTNRLLALTQSVHAGIKSDDSNLSIAGKLQGNLGDAAFVKPGYRRLTRTNGPVMKSVKSGKTTSAVVMASSVQFFTFNMILIIDPPFQNFDSKQLEKIDPAKLHFQPGPWPNSALVLQKPDWFSNSPGFFLVHRGKFPEILKNLLEKMLLRPFILKSASLNYKALSDNILAKIQPEKSYLVKYKALIPGSAPAPVAGNEVISPNSFNPFYSDPVYEQLTGLRSEFFVPNLDQVKPDSFVLLQANPAFIEGFLVGMNQEMGAEFLWRGFPADLNATYFRQFWDKSDSDSTLPDKSDIRPIRLWSAGKELGQNAPEGNTGDPLVFVIKAELVKKYPNLVIYAQKARMNQNGSRNIDKNVPPKTPVFLAGLDPDFLFAGFELTHEEVLGKNGNRGANNGAGWYFVIAERPGEMHFGLDRERESGKKMISWNDLAWTDIPAEINFIDLNNHIPPEPDEDQNLVWGKGESPITPDPSSGNGDAAQMAAILQQKPVQIFIHASLLVS
jgi:hypothetical protein